MARLAIARGFLAEYAKLQKDVQNAVDDDYDHAAAAGVPAVSDRVVGGQASAGANPCTPAPTAPAGD